MDGKTRRLSRIFGTDGKTVIVPVDDSLIFGPFAGLHNIKRKISNILEGKPDAMLAHQGMFINDIASNTVGRIINVSASTINSFHTKKVLVSTIEQLIIRDADCAAVHINMTSKYEADMLSDFGKIVSESEKYALPVMAIIYPRKEKVDGTDENYITLKNSNNREYTKLLCHCVRIAKDMGASLIKTYYSGNNESFIRVIETASSIPIVIAGGEFREAMHMLKITEDAIQCGCKGISFGRNVFSRCDTKPMVEAISAVVHYNATAESAYMRFSPSDEKEKNYEDME
jgi:DhnA family fructose-bisphosphate aldolase class Ia